MVLYQQIFQKTKKLVLATFTLITKLNKEVKLEKLS